MTPIQLANNIHVLYGFLDFLLIVIAGLVYWLVGQTSHVYVLEKRIEALEFVIQEFAVPPSDSPFVD